jgi:hypothetical protein
MGGNVNNEELVNKAVITADALASSGKLNPAQSDRFIDYVIDETVLKDHARIIRFRNESLDIDKIGVGKRVAVPKAEATDPGVRRGITTSKISLQPVEIMVPVEIGDTFREINIEGENVEDTIMRLFANQLGNDLEDLYINGNKLGPARLQSDLLEGGDTTKYVKDTYLALQDGWSLLADGGNVVNAAGANIGLSIFSRAIRALPTKFRRNKSQLRWFMSPDLWQLYLEKLSTRATNLGDNAVTGGGAQPGPFGIPAVPVPLWEFNPLTVEHVTLNGTTPVALKGGPLQGVVVTPTTLGNTPIAPFVETTDYVIDYTLGTIVRNGGGGIGSGNTVKVTYRPNPQLILTHMNNFVIGIGRDIRIEKDRDIYKGVNQYAITAKVSVQIEELSALVKVRNIGTGV